MMGGLEGMTVIVRLSNVFGDDDTIGGVLRRGVVADVAASDRLLCRGFENPKQEKLGRHFVKALITTPI